MSKNNGTTTHMNSTGTIEDIEEDSLGIKSEEHSSGVVAVPIGESCNLLDWGDDAPSAHTELQFHTNSLSTSYQPIIIPTTTSSTTSFLSNKLILKPAAEQQILLNSQKFQELWSTSLTIFDGLLTNKIYKELELKYICSRNVLHNNQDITISSIESSLNKNLIMVMASGEISPQNQTEKNPSRSNSEEIPKGFKFFLYGIEQDDFLLGREGSIFLAQLIFFPPAKEHSSVTVIIKTKNTEGNNNSLNNLSNDTRFGNLILKALSQLYEC